MAFARVRRSLSRESAVVQDGGERPVVAAATRELEGLFGQPINAFAVGIPIELEREQRKKAGAARLVLAACELDRGLEEVDALGVDLAVLARLSAGVLEARACEELGVPEVACQPARVEQRVAEVSLAGQPLRLSAAD